VVALTANAVYGAREELLKAGFDDYVAKPIDTKQLGEVLQKYLKIQDEIILEGGEHHSLGFHLEGINSDEVMEQMNLDRIMSKGHMYQTEMRYYCRKFKTIEVPIHYIGGESSLSGSSVTEALRLLFQLKENEHTFWKENKDA